jgi:predicted dehydrogenase
MTRPAAPLGIGIIGCGNVMEAYLGLADRLEARGLARVAAACGRERQRALISARLPGAAFLTDSQALVESQDVDIVVVLTPMLTHAALARSALLAGKHVLVEKPLATTLENAAELVELAGRSKGHLVCAPFTCLSPTFQAIGCHIARGDVGAIVSARSRYGWAGPDWSEWFYKPGGGPIFDLAVYNITTLTGWLGPVKQVGAMIGTAIPEREINGRRVRVETEDNAQLLLDFGSARLAVITAGFTIQQYRGPAIELYGTEGTIQLLGDDWNPNGYEMWRNSAGCWQCFNESHRDWPWTDGLRHLVECVHAGRKTDVTPEQALHVLDVMLCAQEAGRKGALVEVHSTFAPRTFDGPLRDAEAHRIHDRTRT